MNLTWEKVSPFLSPRAKAQQARVTALLPVLQLRFTSRYGDRITAEREPTFLDVAASALQRRLERDSRAGVASQSVGGASVQYDPRVPLTGWLLPGEIAELDELCGLATGTRTVRAAAPNAIRFGNRADIDLDHLAESDGY